MEPKLEPAWAGGIVSYYHPSGRGAPIGSYVPTCSHFAVGKSKRFDDVPPGLGPLLRYGSAILIPKGEKQCDWNDMDEWSVAAQTKHLGHRAEYVVQPRKEASQGERRSYQQSIQIRQWTPINVGSKGMLNIPGLISRWNGAIL